MTPFQVHVQSYIGKKLVVARRHPTEPLTIYNYTALTQVKGLWDDMTKLCRGLIVHDEGHIVARPYQKFFNVGETGEAEGSPVLGVVPPVFIVMDKLDGSLGITYRTADGKISIATRGSFESAQAKHATAVWHTLYADVVVPEGQTWLFEIIFPKNRIVLDYGGMDDLVLHGCINNATGASLPMPESWPGPRVQLFDARPADELLKLTKPNAEGFVLREHPCPADRPANMVKVKLADYKRLHKLIGGLTPRRLWECLAKGDNIISFLEGVPDEFYKSAMVIVNGLNGKLDEIKASALARWAEICVSLGGVTVATRKAFALRIQQEPAKDQALLFALLSGKPLEPIIWKGLEPSGAAEVEE